MPRTEQNISMQKINEHEDKRIAPLCELNII